MEELKTFCVYVNESDIDGEEWLMTAVEFKFQDRCKLNSFMFLCLDQNKEVRIMTEGE
jgi:hypothetical protein